MKEIYDIKKIDFEECSLKEMLTIISYLVVNTDFSDISLIEKYVSICTQKLDDSLRLKEELTTEYFYLLDILKKKKRSLDRFDSNRNYIRKIEDSFKDKNIFTKSKEKKDIDPFATILVRWLKDENCYLYIRTLLERNISVYNTKVDGKHIVFYILEEYIKNFKIMIKNKNRDYVNKDYLRQIYYLFTKSYYIRLSNDERKELDSILNEFMSYIKASLIKEYRKNAAIKEIKSMKSFNFYKYIPEYTYPKYNDDTLGYEVTRITEAVSRTSDNLEDVFLFRDRAYKVGNNKVSIYTMDISPYIHDKSIMKNYLEYLEYEKVKMDEFIESNFTFKVGHTYQTICYELEFYPSGVVKGLTVSKKDVKIGKNYRSYADFDEDSKELYELYKKVSLKDKGSFASFDLSRVNDYFDELVTKEYLKFMSINKLPLLSYGYKLKSDKEINDDLNEYINLLSKLTKQDAAIITNIICSRIDKSHYSLIPFSNGIYKMTLTDHKNYLSLLNERILHDLYFNDCLLDKDRLQRLKKQYIKELMDIADELNELNDYVDEDMIRINKGEIRRKVNIPSLT